MIVHIRNPKDSKQKLIEMMNIFSKVAGYKINRISHLFFLTLTMTNQKRKVKKRNPFKIASPQKNLEIKLTKEMTYILRTIKH